MSLGILECEMHVDCPTDFYIGTLCGHLGSFTNFIRVMDECRKFKSSILEYFNTARYFVMHCGCTGVLRMKHIYAACPRID